MSGENKIRISKEKIVKCNAIIHSASVAAGGVGAGLAQIPLADSALITPIQIGMIIALGKVFDQEISKSAATAILSSAAASFTGRAVAQVLVGYIPIIGNAINASTAAGITEAVGWLVVDNFSKDEYKKLIETHPLTNEERKQAQEAEKEKNTEKTSTKEDLLARADEFFNGTKNRKSHKEEYNKLLNDFDKFLLGLPKTDPMYTVYNRLMDIDANTLKSNSNDDKGVRGENEDRQKEKEDYQQDDTDLDEILAKIVTRDPNAPAKNGPYIVVHRQSKIIYKGHKGYLVWDWLMYNELTFEEIETGTKISLATKYDDSKMKSVFDKIVNKYGVDDF